jgi:type II secretion system protein G
MRFRNKAFTLIELLIVVAIIAILAAIAVPNFLEAQVRSKVSRAKNDMRSLANALEAYQVDTNHYPPDIMYGWVLFNDLDTGGLSRLTTPVAYMTSVPKDAFPVKQPGQRDLFYYRYIADGWYQSITSPTPIEGIWNLGGWGKDPDWMPSSVWERVRYSPAHKWALASAGPDQHTNTPEWSLFGEDVYDMLPGRPPQTYPGAFYDPTNGTVSNGDIIRVGP